MTTLEKKNEIVRLRGLGNSYDSIASITSVSKPTVVKICNALNSDIETIQIKNQESMKADLTYSIEKRSEMYQHLISRIYREVAGRDLTEIDTSKLVTMLERTERALTNIETRTNLKNSISYSDMSDTDLSAIAKAISAT